MISWFKWGNVDSRQYGILVTGTNPYSSPERQYTATEVVGRYGSIYADNGGFKNVSVSYTCQINGGKSYGFNERFERFRKALIAQAGYQKLTDSYNDGIIRQGFLSVVVEPAQMGAQWLGGEFVVTFSCKPQRWVESCSIDATFGLVGVGGINADGGLNNYQQNMRSGLITATPGSAVVIRPDYDQAFAFAVHEYDEDGTWLRYRYAEFTSTSTLLSYTLGSDTHFVKLRWNNSRSTGPHLNDDNALNVIVSGKLVETVSNSGVKLKHPAEYDVYPVIRLERTSTAMAAEHYFMFGSQKIVVQPFTGTLVIDCENQTVYDGSGNHGEKYICIYDADGGYAYEYPHISNGEIVLNTLDIMPSTEDPYFSISVSGIGRTV